MIKKIKILGMLLDVVHRQVQRKHITKESDGFPNHSNLLTMPVCHVLKGSAKFCKEMQEKLAATG